VVGNRKSSEVDTRQIIREEALYLYGFSACLELHCKECYLSNHYHHIAFRRGKKRVAVALGHTLLIISYHVIANEKEYEELGGDYLDQLDRQGKEKRLIRQLEKRGFQVSVTPTAPVA
jgi:hypothetical protein